MNAPLRIDRRDFLATLGGGIVVLFGLGASPVSAQRPSYPDDFHAYLAIGGNGRVTIFSSKIEMGRA